MFIFLTLNQSYETLIEQKKITLRLMLKLQCSTEKYGNANPLYLRISDYEIFLLLL